MSKYNLPEDYMTEIENGTEGYGVSRTTFDKMINMYNLSRLPDYENVAEPYIAYIFMSRPSLNLVDTYSIFQSTAYANFQAMQLHPTTAAFVNDAYGRKLLMQLSENYANITSRWLPIITTKAMSYDVNDIELKSVEKGNTYYGHMIKYGKRSEAHKVAGSLSIEFRSDRYLSILKMMYLWSSYISLVSNTDLISPRHDYQENAVLDYGASIYYVVCRRDGREIVYWDKVIGLFPKKIPLSMFSSSDTFIMKDTVTIEFDYGIRADPMDPTILMDINMLSTDSSNVVRGKTSGQYSLSDEVVPLPERNGLFVANDIYANNPYVTVQKSENGVLKYMLRWEGVN